MGFHRFAFGVPAPPASRKGRAFPFLLSVLVLCGAVFAPPAGSQPAPHEIFRSSFQRLPFGEQPSLRASSARTIRNLDGSFTLQAFSSPVHFRNGAGQWSTIDSRLVASTHGDYVRATAANSFSFLFKQQSVADFLRVETGRTTFSLTLLGAKTGFGHFEGSHAEYLNVFPGVDLRYDVLPAGLKETLLIHDASAPTSYRFLLRHQGGERGRPTRERDGRIFFRSPQNGTVLYALEPPLLVEGRKKGESSGRTSHKVALEFEEAGNGTYVDLIVDRQWLKDPKRRFPIELDPTLSTLTSLDEASFPDCVGGEECLAQRSDRLSIGGGPEDPLKPGSQVFSAGLQFDVAAIPEGSEVTDATLELYFDGTCLETNAYGADCGTSHKIDAHLVTDDWDNWTPDHDPTPLVTYTLPHDATPRWMEWDVTSGVNGWVTGESLNHGVLLKRDPDAEESSGPVVPSSWFTTPALRPRLSVTYVAPGEYTYEEALDFGLDTPPTPTELGLPECEPDENATGFPTAEAAEEAADEAPENPVCAPDPAETLIGVGTQGPVAVEAASTGYHHNGGETSQKFEGGKVTIEVANPAVDHTSDLSRQEFVVARVLSKVTGKWLEVGWGETSYWPQNKPFVYSFKKGDSIRPKTNGWNRHTEYDISAGEDLSVRIRDCDVGACADILWKRGNNPPAWEPVGRRHYGMHCRNDETHANLCWQEVFLEIFSDQPESPHPVMNTSDGVNFSAIRLRTQPGTWPLWGEGFPPAGNVLGVEPYDVGCIALWHHFRAGKNMD